MEYATKIGLNYENHTGKLRASGTEESNGFPEIGVGGSCIGTGLASSELDRSNLHQSYLSYLQT
jgi:hypothetical protein